MTKPTIGFIGVGLMGHGMAKNIVEAGYPLVTMAHRKRDAVDDLIKRGATEAQSPKDIAEKSDIIHLCVTGSPQVEANIRGPNGLLAGLKPQAIIVDSSTSDPVSTIALAGRLAAAGCAMADAPLGGTPVQAEAGQLSTMVGASDEVFARLQPVFATFTNSFDYLGAFGNASKMKYVINLMVAIHNATTAEALTLAVKSGVDPALVYKIAEESFVASPGWKSTRKAAPPPGRPSTRTRAPIDSACRRTRCRPRPVPREVRVASLPMR